ALESLLDHPLVSEVRAGTGVLGAVQIDPERIAADPTISAAAANHSRAAGVITRAVGGGGLQASPPLTISLSQLDELAAGLRAGLDAVV
ncbi:MAG: aspartate aminotransferase family protein, partial [Acidimicrobiia bacterium]|nr:aspartate aminotransferase family protein [Acidimicrobiia bacterium]